MKVFKESKEVKMKDLILDVNDVCKILKRKQAYGYKVIRELNQELKEKGYYVSEGRISAKYFYERMHIDPEDEQEETE